MLNFGRRRGRSWHERFAAAKTRLRQPLWWYPAPALLGAGLALVLTSHVLLGTNPRAGNPADVLTFPGESRKDSAVWLSMTPMGKEVVVTTNDRRVFRWPQDTRDLSTLRPLVEYLKSRVAVEVGSAALSGRATPAASSAVIAADQRLKFLHVRPVLYAFAEAGITQYAFETQNPVVASAEDHQAPAASGAHGEEAGGDQIH
jgi:hypothetical protein